MSLHEISSQEEVSLLFPFQIASFICHALYLKIILMKSVYHSPSMIDFTVFSTEGSISNSLKAMNCLWIQTFIHSISHHKIAVVKTLNA